ncbi:MAG: beta-lactamase family protein [Pirellulales bacterium]|nr:beta-lactamase family protein [Pirellulales bacterium]
MKRYCHNALWLPVLLMLLVASVPPCTAGEPSQGSLPLADPASVDMDAAKLAQIPQRIEQYIAQKQISGAVTLVARRGRIVHLEAVGHADLKNDLPMQKDSLFAIASMTKPITATAVMMLQDEGKLSLDEPVAKYIPSFRNVALDSGPPTRAITLRDLITHTSGVVGSQRTEATLQETVEEIARRPLGFEPGSQWQYSPGLNVCGRVVEIVSGQSYDEFLRERILQPLDMADTTFSPDASQRKRIARIYQPTTDKSGIEPVSHWLTDDAGQRAPNPSGGLFSTASDIARFYQMILNGGQLGGRRILSKQAVKQMTSVQTGELTTGFTPGNGWGLGWCVVRQPQGVTKMLSPGSCGHGGAFGTQSWLDPQREMIFVLMIQRTNFGNSDASSIRGDFQQLAVEALGSGR